MFYHFIMLYVLIYYYLFKTKSRDNVLFLLFTKVSEWISYASQSDYGFKRLEGGKISYKPKLNKGPVSRGLGVGFFEPVNSHVVTIKSTLVTT